MTKLLKEGGPGWRCFGVVLPLPYELLVSPPLAKQEVTGPRPVNIAVVKNNGIDAVVLSAPEFSFRNGEKKIE